MPDTIALAACRPRAIYRIQSRNLRIGVFDGVDGFIGIREKLGSRYLATEYHWDRGAPLGTARPLEKIGDLDSSIELVERFGAIDTRTGRPVAFDRPVAAGGRGWVYLDTDEPDQDIRPQSVPNTVLFAVLDAHEARTPR